jgi:hypothetical protein
MLEELPYCDFNKVTGKFKYHPNLPPPLSGVHDYRDHLKYGMSGLVSL